ncbi:hypothetical protein [Calidifontibacter terrae]
MRSPVRLGRPPRRPSDETLLAAAREGWGVSIRLGLLLVVCGIPTLALLILVMI